MTLRKNSFEKSTISFGMSHIRNAIGSTSLFPFSEIDAADIFVYLIWTDNNKQREENILFISFVHEFYYVHIGTFGFKQNHWLGKNIYGKYYALAI